MTVTVTAELSEKDAEDMALRVECPKCQSEKGEKCKVSGQKSHFLRYKAAATKIIRRALK